MKRSLLFTPPALADNADYTTVNEDEWSAVDATAIDLSAASSPVTISEAGVYQLSGSLQGQVLVEAAEDALVVLVLDSAHIDNPDGPAIEVRGADDVAIHLAEGSENLVSDASSYAEDAEANAAIYSEQDLTISGSGSLAVQANGNDGITSKDDLVILSGNVAVSAADDALRGKDSLVVEGGSVVLDATAGDGLKSDQEDDETQGYVYISGGSIDIAAGDDGVQAQTDTIIAGGSLAVSAADDGVKGEVILSVGDGQVTVTESTEAMEAAYIGISGGTIDLTASDDGINASGATELGAADSGAAEPAAESAVGPGGGMAGGGMADTGERLEISGGSVTVDAEGDGIDSNGSLSISGGDTVVYGPTRAGNGGIDANGAISVTGGTVRSLSAGGMEVGLGDDGQGWVLVSASLGAGQEAEIVDESGAVVATFTSRKQASSVTYSAADIEHGSTYAVNVDGVEVGAAVAGEGAESMGGPGGVGGAPGGAGHGPGDGAAAPGALGGFNSGEMPEGMKPPEGMEPPTS
ncbi:carbohydrate-binding domain-containing protein [Leucobacter denitrificans]|uniref:Carbohydrate-binding domain-containing protein n=1 Tax=Leucobacter denitrificans TaxID=683042 RepID=A0A7G9S234_9MICO|nr:carbohydrate-binding domain-containing protein [Leucobacter denitrificans]QNN61909.1 carbohydrate-binding domain-containing protein [Leucobacter denitrificans]